MLLIHHSKRIFITVLCLISLCTAVSAQETIHFPSLDSITIGADLYMAHDQHAPFIILFHQATYSRGEYLEIAPKLNEAGFNCWAVDLRSGYAANQVANITFQNAKKAKMPYRFIDTQQDIEAAVAYARKHYAKGQLIIWGSSYSAALVIRHAGELQNVDGVISFSPGEYFKNEGKPADYIAQSAQKVSVPVFITSKKSEENWKAIYAAIPNEDKVYFTPGMEGKHGSAALWETTDGHKYYWEEVLFFLNQFQ